MSRIPGLIGCASLALVIGGGCAMQQEQVAQGPQHPGPVNCATADGDLRVLRAEKANVAQQLLEGATAIYPAGAVVGMLTGVEGTKISVATGEYNAAIDAPIAQIRQKCGL